MGGTYFTHRAKFAAFSEEKGDELEVYEWVLPTSAKLTIEELRNGIVSQLKHLSKLNPDATLVPVRAFNLVELPAEDGMCSTYLFTFHHGTLATT